MTCAHIPIQRVTYYDCTAVECQRCGAKWREWSITIDDDEYDACLLLLAAFDRAVDWRETTEEV